MRDQTQTLRRRSPKTLLFASSLAAATLTLGVVAASVSAGEFQPPEATAVGACIGEDGYINVEIIDNSKEEYDVFIDDVLVATDISDTGGKTISFGPFDDGTYNVRVDWVTEDDEILNKDVTLDCVPDDTTTTAAAPTTTAAAAAPAAAAATASPRFTG